MTIDLNKVLGYSKDCLKSRAVMRSVILDLYPGMTREMNVLLSVYESGVPIAIKNAGTINSLQYNGYIQKIVNDYGLQEKYVVEGLDAWIDICIAPGTAAKLKANATIPAPASVQQINTPKIQNPTTTVKSVENVSGSLSDYEIKQVAHNQIEITKFKGFDEKELVIPSDINGEKVVGVGIGAYEGCKTVEKIIIAEGIEYIENSSFANCERLKSVVFPSTLQRIGTKIKDFYNNYSFRTPTFSNTIGAFEKTQLVSVTIPENVKYLGEATFAECKSLKRISIEYGISVINRRTFMGCTALEIIELPESIGLIQEQAFAGCGIKELILPHKLKEISALSFSYCENLGNIRFNEGLKTIGDYAFLNCNKITKMVIPSSVKNFGVGIVNTSLIGRVLPNEYVYGSLRSNKRNDKVVFYCFSGSDAIEYARKEGYRIENAAKLSP